MNSNALVAVAVMTAFALGVAVGYAWPRSGTDQIGRHGAREPKNSVTATIKRASRTPARPSSTAQRNASTRRLEAPRRPEAAVEHTQPQVIQRLAPRAIPAVAGGDAPRYYFAESARAAPPKAPGGVVPTPSPARPSGSLRPPRHALREE